MKRILILLSLVLFLFGTSKTFAQPRFGVQAGLNFANMTISSDAASLSNKNKLGINLGVLADFSLSEKFAVQPGLLFSTKGYKNDEGGGTFRAAINYIEIPDFTKSD